MGPRSFLASTIGQKVVMAVTGAILFGFVLGHLAGNLLLYQGPDAINAYGHELRTFLHGAALPLARVTLLLAVVLHIWAACSLTVRNVQARPHGYRQLASQASTYASRTMRWSGVIVLAFVVYHLMHFTFGNVHPSFVEGDVYHNVVAGFRVWPVALFYVFAMVLLGLHLNHGVWSMFQSIGVNHPRYTPMLKKLAAYSSILLVLGFISIPIAVATGVMS